MSTLIDTKMNNNRILILEDDQIVAVDLQELLITAGYETIIAHTYTGALIKAKTFKPNLAICDINLGDGLTGIDFVKDVYIILPKLEIIYVTAFSNKQIIEDAELTNPLNYIVKPWNEEQIKVTVKMAFTYIEKKHQNNTILQDLSMSEYKIIDLISKQKKSKEIAALLFVSEKTVRNHRYNIIKKLNLPNDNNSLLKWAITNIKQD
jgi:DNA-binding NarL/FixJ family response regulator